MRLDDVANLIKRRYQGVIIFFVGCFFLFLAPMDQRRGPLFGYLIGLMLIVFSITYILRKDWSRAKDLNNAVSNLTDFNACLEYNGFNADMAKPLLILIPFELAMGLICIITGKSMLILIGLLFVLVIPVASYYAYKQALNQKLIIDGKTATIIVEQGNKRKIYSLGVFNKINLGTGYRRYEASLVGTTEEYVFAYAYSPKALGKKIEEIAQRYGLEVEDHMG